ncbi:MAG: hypothetical protein HUU35_19355, partial [Armatimonadetes bacterium]|nr:hypothetical protein [Armatimonadota bacterium]
GGRVVSQPVAAGQAAAEVVGQLDSYRLWRQVLPLGSFPEGSRWRLTARLRGDAIRPGDVGWKVGTLRFAVNTGTTTYVAAPPLTGTFDWRTESVELTIPAGLKSLEVQIGQNGSSGTLWSDEVTLQRLPGEGG